MSVKPEAFTPPTLQDQIDAILQVGSIQRQAKVDAEFNLQQEVDARVQQQQIADAPMADLSNAAALLAGEVGLSIFPPTAVPMGLFDMGRASAQLADDPSLFNTGMLGLAALGTVPGAKAAGTAIEVAGNTVRTRQSKLRQLFNRVFRPDSQNPATFDEEFANRLRIGEVRGTRRDVLEATGLTDPNLLTDRLIELDDEFPGLQDLMAAADESVGLRDDLARMTVGDENADIVNQWMDLELQRSGLSDQVWTALENAIISNDPAFELRRIMQIEPQLEQYLSGALSASDEMMRVASTLADAPRRIDTGQNVINAAGITPDQLTLLNEFAPTWQPGGFVGRHEAAGVPGRVDFGRLRLFEEGNLFDARIAAQQEMRNEFISAQGYNLADETLDLNKIDVTGQTPAAIERFKSLGWTLDEGRRFLLNDIPDAVMDVAATGRMPDGSWRSRAQRGTDMGERVFDWIARNRQDLMPVAAGATLLGGGAVSSSLFGGPPSENRNR